MVMVWLRMSGDEGDGTASRRRGVAQWGTIRANRFAVCTVSRRPYDESTDAGKGMPRLHCIQYLIDIRGASTIQDTEAR
jgi:hypothetical protein